MIITYFGLLGKGMSSLYLLPPFPPRRDWKQTNIDQERPQSTPCYFSKRTWPDFCFLPQGVLKTSFHLRGIFSSDSATEPCRLRL